MDGYFAGILLIAFGLVIMVAGVLLIRDQRRRRYRRIAKRMAGQGKPWPVYPARVMSADIINDYEAEVTFVIEPNTGEQLEFSDVFGIAELLVMSKLAIEYDAESGSYQFVDAAQVAEVENQAVIEVAATVVAEQAATGQSSVVFEVAALVPLHLEYPVEQELVSGQQVKLLIHPQAPLQDAQVVVIDTRVRQ